MCAEGLSNVRQCYWKPLLPTQFQILQKNHLKLDFILICYFLHCWSRIVVYLGKKDFPGTGRCVVGIVTRLRTGRPGIVVEFPTGSSYLFVKRPGLLWASHRALFSSTVSAVRVGKAALVCGWGCVHHQFCDSVCQVRHYLRPCLTFYTGWRLSLVLDRNWLPNGALKIRQTLFPSKATLIIFALRIFSQGILNCQIWRVWIWCDLLFRCSSITFFRLVYIILASACQRSILVTWHQTLTCYCYPYRIPSVLLAPSA